MGSCLGYVHCTGSIRSIQIFFQVMMYLFALDCGLKSAIVNSINYPLIVMHVLSTFLVVAAHLSQLLRVFYLHTEVGV